MTILLRLVLQDYNREKNYFATDEKRVPCVIRKRIYHEKVPDPIIA